MRKDAAPMGIAVLALLAVAATSNSSFAQAGSTGGTVGKADKSVSGAEEAPSTAARKKLPTRPDTQREYGKVRQSRQVLLMGRAPLRVSHFPQVLDMARTT
jgi:hypothetical protein